MDSLGNPCAPTDDCPTVISKQRPNPTPIPSPLPHGLTSDDARFNVKGYRLAHFELEEAIGAGGMAAVMRARDTQLDRLVALKVLPTGMASDPEIVRRFHQEARSAAKLDHENIARVFFCGEDKGLHFIAFEFVEGENLRVVLENRGRLPLSEAIHYMLQVGAGLVHACGRGVVHRDIKPSNIIITPQGRAKLVDMGLARSLAPRSEEDLTQSGVTLGTFDYISPEQALEPRDADIRSDIYSLGCTFYHLLTGKPPVPEGTAARKLHHHQNLQPPNPRQFVPHLPEEVVRTLQRMMEKNPRDRFQTPEEMVGALKDLEAKFGPEGPTSQRAALAPAQKQASSSKAIWPIVWASVGALGVLLIGFLLDSVPRVKPPSPSALHLPRKEPLISPDNQPDSPPVVEEPRMPPILPPAPSDAELAREARYVAPAEPTLKHLMDWLADHADLPRLELLLAGELDLSSLQAESTQGLVLRAEQKIVIRSRDPKQPATLKFAYDPAITGDTLSGLTLDTRESEMEDIRLVIDAQEAEVNLTGLNLRGGRHQIRRCEFIQVHPSLQPEKIFSSIHAESAASRSEVTLDNCVFAGFGKVTSASETRERRNEAIPFVEMAGRRFSDAETGGHVAILRDGGVRFTISNCAFGPHLTAFRLAGTGSGESPPFSVRQCTVMLSPRRSAA
ncbi:MAG: serine/threonine-protein kinase, partial [Gemmataceae bacterium]